MTTDTRPDTHGMAVQVAVRLAHGSGFEAAVEAVASLNSCPVWMTLEACRYVSDATCDPYLKRLGAQYLPEEN